MKRLSLVLAAAFLLAMFGPVPTTNASWWPWGHHSKKASSTSSTAEATATPAPKSKSSKPKKAKTPKAKHEKHQQASGEHLYSIPRTVGWFRKGPGPAGAGS